MGIIATSLRHLLAAGITGEALISAISDIEDAQTTDNMPAKSRSANAERQARFREKKRYSNVTGVTSNGLGVTNNADVTPNNSPQTVTDNVTTVISNDSNVTSNGVPPEVLDGFPHPSLDSYTSPKENPLKGSKEKPQRKEKSEKADPPFVLPDWIPSKAWDDYVAMRQRIRKPMTTRAKELAVITLEKLRAAGYEPVAVLDGSTEHSYVGLFKPKTEEKNYGNKPARTTARHTGFEQQDYFGDNLGFRVVGENPGGGESSDEGSPGPGKLL